MGFEDIFSTDLHAKLLNSQWQQLVPCIACNSAIDIYKVASVNKTVPTTDATRLRSKVFSLEDFGFD